MSEIDLTSNQRKALAALLTHTSVEAAAESIGLARSTLFRYLADDMFKAALAAAETAAIEQAARLMAGASVGAVVALRDVLHDPAAGPKVKVSAARSILALLPSVRLLGSIEQKLADLESNRNADATKY